MIVRTLKQPAPGLLRPGRRVYAVGDIHGCAERLDALHALIVADLHAHPPAAALLLHLGDLIDRGPDSAGVVDRLAVGSPVPGLPTLSLRGNHEQMMLDALDGARGALADWRNNGGEQALRSWDVKWPKKNRALSGELPPQHVAFLRALPLIHVIDGYAFVHAGVRPGVPLAEQVPDDLLWIRRAFLQWPGVMLPEAPQMAIVHGHTPEPHPIVTPNRVGVDTGAVRGGALTCAVLEGAEVYFLAV